MNLPIIILVTVASIFTFPIWIAIILILFFLKSVRKARQNNANLSNQPFIEPQENPAPKQNNRPSQQPAPDRQSCTIGQDEGAFTLDDDPQPTTDASPDPQSEEHKINLRSREKLRKAIIYYEIFKHNF